MAEPVLLYERHEGGRIVVMTMNRPEFMNAMNGELRNALWEGFERFAADEEAWVLILTGAGERAFCAGMDLHEMAAVRSGQAAPQPGRPMPIPLSESLNCWKPTIAAVNGYAIAGGWMLAQQCDIRLAAEHAEFGITEARLNQSNPFLYDLTRQMHLQHALELVLWGDRRITAQRAYEIGWVSRVLPKEQLMDEAMSWARRVLLMGPRAVRNAKEILYRTYHMDPFQGRAFQQALDQNLAGMEDTIEGPRSFVEGRAPSYKNR